MVIVRRLIAGFTRSMTTRAMSTNSTLPDAPTTAREIEIPVPWGVIAGKEWGDANGEPWIVSHGWLDNCGSFDTLAPLFPSGHRLICIDIPGHGFSSHYPEGQWYHYIECVAFYRRIALHLGLEKFNLMGHSMGAGMSSLFAATHPEMVNRLIMLDSVKPISRDPAVVVERTRKSVDELLSFEKKLSEKGHTVYTYDEALQRLLLGANHMHGKEAITEASARILLRRGLKKSDCGSGYVFTRDLRHRVTSLFGFPHEVLREFAKAISCPHLVIKASEGPYYEGRERAEDAISTFRKNPEFYYQEVEGSHHVHLNEPQKIMPYILEFIQNSKHISGSKI